MLHQALRFLTVRRSPERRVGCLSRSVSRSRRRVTRRGLALSNCRTGAQKLVTRSTERHSRKSNWLSCSLLLRRLMFRRSRCHIPPCLTARWRCCPDDGRRRGLLRSGSLHRLTCNRFQAAWSALSAAGSPQVELFSAISAGGQVDVDAAKLAAASGDWSDVRDFAELDFLANSRNSMTCVFGADDGNRTRVFSLGS